jgi:flagellar hook assembly protein FlgD
MVLGAYGATLAPPVRADQVPDNQPKAVFIVGPASSSTSEYIREANEMAASAAAEGMRVIKIYTPHATWAAVKEKAQHANLLVYFGHGNGFPSPYRSRLSEKSEDGFGLNPCSGKCGYSAPAQYHGGKAIRAGLRLAPHSVVVLYRLCYASGNAEGGMRPMSPASKADRAAAFQRVDNFAAAFLKVGAGAVFAWGWPQKIDLPQQLARTNHSMDKIFMDKANDTGSPNAFIGTRDYYGNSRRTPGAQIHFDPHPTYGYLRALTGDLRMTAAEWRSGAGPDTTPPGITDVSARDGSATDAADSDPLPSFSPNGDGLDDRLVIGRTLSEPATLDTQVRDDAGNLVTEFSEMSHDGAGKTIWDGTDSVGDRVPDGRYTIAITPTDRAGNVGDPASIDVLVLTALASPTADAEAINAADADGLPARVTFSAELREPAAVNWVVVDHTGSPIRSAEGTAGAEPGPLSFTWDGTDDSGAVVPNGTYAALVSATTADGTLAYATPVFVGPFTVRLSDDTPKRGQLVNLVVRNTEPLVGPITVRVRQPGLKAYSLRLRKLDPATSRLRFKLKGGGTKGTVVFTVTGTNSDGTREKLTVSRHLH